MADTMDDRAMGALTPDGKRLNDPESAILSNLNNVDDLIVKIRGPQPTDVTMAHMAIAQVYATSALVHAVRDLTQAVRETAGPVY
ncbi:MAG: hypothetical protein JWN52_3590 [Actinomycetia bacterium]|nr:hypothetical protein [Actinomycetes bacterium]